MKLFHKLGILLIAAASLTVWAEGDADSKDVTGEIVDLSCYISHNASGEKHAKCAKSCAAKGLPIGVLTEAGEVYLLIENHDKADAYAMAKEKAAETVTVSGVVFDKGGVKAIQVLAVN